MRHIRIISLGVVAVIIAAVCIRLGLWQLDRLDERRAENARIAAGIGGEPVEMEAVGTDSSRSRALRVRLRGDYDFDNEIVLINRSRDGSPGVNILTPVRVPGRDTAVIVNRGWVYSADGTTIEAERWREPTAARGVAYPSWLLTSRGTQARAPGPPTTTHTTSRRVSHADRNAIAALLPYPVAPYQLVLLDSAAIDNAGAAYGGAGVGPMGTGEPQDRSRPVRIPLPALDEGPHRSYAMQWFAFAAIALIGTAAVARREWAPGADDSAL